MIRWFQVQNIHAQAKILELAEMWPMLIWPELACLAAHEVFDMNSDEDLPETLALRPHSIFISATGSSARI